MVVDTGVGMNADQLSRLFQPFTKIMTNRTLNRDGVGLGLTVSRNIARALGGDIHVASAEDKGTTISLLFPYSETKE